ncbi:hypothetical protein N657DRAFT_650118 [Parathielavia appendiculata]|uniref:Uncharacterized protein n=1 Tax=Parathielavia appendiculata TaxID=2587402 RepID=A0AAN6YZ12_9PEZI|nr:hypothetical protein N657DRAFT_650118 [Parathielavia appendiculata]
MKVIALFSALLLPTSAFAAGGRCSGSWNDDRCICIDNNECRRYGGDPIQGSPGDWPCPSDPDNVWGCWVWDNCPGLDSSTGCMWRNGCIANRGTVRREEVCPGGVDFICCDF